jgi:formate-dependent nitrite reductase cytochrome c552 subunit
MIGCERKVINESANDNELTSCFTCHNDEDGLLQQAKGEWQNSVHASGANIDYTNRASATCTQCHDHQGFLDYLNTGQTNAPYDPVSAIHCFTCHAPHTSGTLALRTEAPYVLANGVTFNHGAANLCVSCHHATMSASSIGDTTIIASARAFSPHHGTQSDLLQGTNGYEYDEYEYEISPHATAVDDACVGCHMANVQTHDGYMVGGHSFNMVDEETGSNLSKYCAAECHPEATDYDYEGTQTEIEDLLIELRNRLDDIGVLAYTQGSWLPNVPTGDTLKIYDRGLTGALYNFLLIEDDRSLGVHNYEYIKGLLESSIDYVTSIPPTAAPIKMGKAGMQPIASH